MSIAFDAQSTVTVSSASSISGSHTCASGSVLVVGIILKDSGNTQHVISGTYGGVSFSFVSTTSTTNRVLELWICNAPPSGVNTISFTFSGSTSNGADYRAMSYTGAIQSGQPDSHNQGTTAPAVGNISISTTTIAATTWLVGFAQLDNGGTITAGSNTFYRGSTSGVETLGFDSNGNQNPAGSYSLTVNTSAFPLNAYQMNLVSISAANIVTFSVSDTITISEKQKYTLSMFFKETINLAEQTISVLKSKSFLIVESITMSDTILFLRKIAFSIHDAITVIDRFSSHGEWIETNKSSNPVWTASTQDTPPTWNQPNKSSGPTWTATNKY